MIRPRNGKPWPWSTIREPRPEDWQIGMTVCVAVENRIESYLVVVSDMKVSTTDMSADFASIKVRSIGSRWVVTFSGSDMTPVMPIIRKAKRLLTRGESVIEIERAFVDAYKSYIQELAEANVLSPIGYTLEEFKKHGLEQLGQEQFSRHLYELEQQKTDAQFLVAGYDDSDPMAHIFTVSYPGVVNNYSTLGLWAIGSGQTNALGSLFNADIKTALYSTMPETIYRACEAKFNAENAEGVGKETAGIILTKDGYRKGISGDGIRKLKLHWQRTRVLKVPQEAQADANEIWKSFCDERKSTTAKPSSRDSSQ